MWKRRETLAKINEVVGFQVGSAWEVFVEGSSDRLHKVLEFVSTVHDLCAVLGLEFYYKLAKIAENKVVAICGGKDKAILSKDLEVDCVIDYKEESIKDVLKKEFPKGIDIVYESVGDMFDTCFSALAVLEIWCLRSRNGSVSVVVRSGESGGDMV
ncbi:probable quinone oxidoreductase, partial [Tanacetum coccineum]